MPVASSSRPYGGRRHRRAPTSDIEEDGPSQAAMNAREVDDVEMGEEEEEEQPRRSKKGKKKRVQQDDSDAEVEEEQEEIPAPEIEDQPVGKAQAKKLQGVVNDWTTMREKVHKPGYELITDIASAIAEHTEGERGDKAVVDIDRLMRDLLDTEQELTAHERTLDDIYQKLMADETVMDVKEVYEKTLQEKMNQYNSKTARQKYAKSDSYQKFKQAIYEVRHPDTAMPPLVDLIPKEDGDVSDDDDDIQMGGITQDYKCPLTLAFLDEPLTSRHCGHSYSGSAIRDYLAKKPQVCPSTGCRQMLKMSDMVPNKELAKRAAAAARREKEREEDKSDDEEEIIE